MNTIKHLQTVIISIVKDIDQLCRDNNIEYYLFGGSAIGAIRHRGFIPWDDDLDIVMTHENYEKFVQVCRRKLDKEKYYFQQSLVDWPMLHSKVRLKGTVFDEPGAYGNRKEERGIFVDVFKLDNAPKGKLLQLFQYFCSKYLLCYCLHERGYKEASLYKKILMLLSIPVNFKPLKAILYHQLVKYNNKETEFCASFGARFKFKNTFFRRELYSNPIYVPFEDIKLPVPEKFDELLTQIYGNYLTPPPAHEQVGWHLCNVDFGKY